MNEVDNFLCGYLGEAHKLKIQKEMLEISKSNESMDNS